MILIKKKEPKKMTLETAGNLLYVNVCFFHEQASYTLIKFVQRKAKKRLN